jgi:DNA primase large subunit
MSQNPSDLRNLQSLFIQFPWLNGTSEFLFAQIQEGMDSDQLEIEQAIELIFSKFPGLHTYIIQIFKQIIQNEEDYAGPTTQIQNLAMYPILQILLVVLGNRILGNGLANLFAKHCQQELRNMSKKLKNAEKIYVQIARNIGIECDNTSGNFVDNIKFSFKIAVPSYLKTAAKITGEEWKLINRYVQKGYVYLSVPDLIMLIRETVREKVKPDFTQGDKVFREKMATLPSLVPILKEIEGMIEEHQQRFQGDILSEGEKIGSELYPPCMKHILLLANQGENLSHYERLAIAFYFLNTNHTIEETVDIFRTSPDFDEKISRYQVEFAAGEGGKGKKYTMYNCAKLKSLNMCKASDPNVGDPLCQKGGRKKDGTYNPIRHPINDYVFWKRVEQQRLEFKQQRQNAMNQPQKDGNQTGDPSQRYQGGDKGDQ